MDLTIGLFYRNYVSVPHYDRNAGEEISAILFPSTKSYITEGNARVDSDFTRVDGDMVRGGAERTNSFFRY